MKKGISVLVALLLSLQATIVTTLYPVKVDASTVSQNIIFSDSFESNDFTTGGWVATPLKSAIVNKSAELGKDASMERSLDLQGYENIALSLDFFLAVDGVADTVDVEWYNGSTWSLLGNISLNDTICKKDFSISNANNNSNFKIRFNTKFNQELDKIYLCNITIFGDKIFQQIFSDNFSSNNYTSGGWNISGNCSVVEPTNSFSRIYQGGIMEKSINMSEYENIKLSFDSTVQSDLANDVLAVEWYDGDKWTLLENLAADGFNQPKSYLINASRISNFKIRFKAVFNDIYDFADIDNIVLTAQKAPILLFSEGFESNDFISGGWVNGQADISRNNIYKGLHSAALNEGDSFKKAFSTVGYRNIKVKYALQSNNCESDDIFTCEWYDGNKWIVIDSSSGNSPWELKQYTLPLNAEENPYFQLRFKVKNGINHYTFIDNVEVSAENSGKTQNGLLIIVSNPLYKTGTVAQAIETYKSDIENEYGWHNEIITVNNVNDTSATVRNATPELLKTVIGNYYNQGYKGFVFIGSQPAIPVPFIQIYDAQNPENNDILPTDLFYADISSWGTLQPNGSYHLDTSNLLKYSPEMFYGRISPGSIVDTLTEEANLVVEYLNKVHDYRLNGSNLTQEQQKRVLLFYDSKDFKLSHGDISMFRTLGTEIHGVFDDTKTTPDTLEENLQNGYQFANLFIHSSSVSHSISTLQGDKFEGSSFHIERLKSITPKVHNINLYCCSACRFSEQDNTKIPNLGTTYLFSKKDGNPNYMLTVTGSTGSWGPSPSETYWENISDGLSIGESFKNYLVSAKGNGVQKAVLLGDPTLRYKVPLVSNMVPYPSENLAGGLSDIRYRAQIGKPFTIIPVDESGETPIISVEGLPAGADVQNTNGQFTWTPVASDNNKIYDLTLKIVNKNEAGNVVNTYIENFSLIALNYFFTEDFENDSLASGEWESSNSIIQHKKAKEGKSSVQLNQNGYIIKSISTQGYKDIKLEYVRTTATRINTTATFTCEWYDGTAWRELESFVGSKPFRKDTFPIPAEANNNPSFKIRFSMTNNVDLETGFVEPGFVDSITIYGVEIIQ